MGRYLHHAANADLTAAVITEVEAELGAVERAELGDLSGRSVQAVQAVQLTRQDASPVQVAAADRILTAYPLGGDELFLELDPTSACVAAAHWLQAAAQVVAQVSGVAATEVVVEADNIEALPHETPTEVLELMDMGVSPTAVVTNLIRDAMALAEGKVLDLDELRGKIEEAQDNAERYAKAAAEFSKVRLTTLDPRRPARDMLEDLLSGIRGCWLLYREYAETPEGLADDDSGMSEDELDDAIDAAFCDAVQSRAAVDRYLLDLEPRPAATVVDTPECDADDEYKVDVNLEAEDTCEHLVRLVLESDDWDIPRDIMDSVLELEHEHAGRLATLLIARAVGYLVSFNDTGITSEQLDTAVNWIGDGQGAEYAGPAASVAALAGHAGSQALLAERLGVDDLTFDHLAGFFGRRLLPGNDLAVLRACCHARGP